MNNTNRVDIKENDILKQDSKLLSILLSDNSTKQNIIWATDNYVSLGEGYNANEEITIPLITGNNGILIDEVIDFSTIVMIEFNGVY